MHLCCRSTWYYTKWLSTENLVASTTCSVNGCRMSWHCYWLPMFTVDNQFCMYGTCNWLTRSTAKAKIHKDYTKSLTHVLSPIFSSRMSFFSCILLYIFYIVMVTNFSHLQHTSWHLKLKRKHITLVNSKVQIRPSFLFESLSFLGRAGFTGFPTIFYWCRADRGKPSDLP